jgi:ABC-2 type transport system ATP-binding protein
LSLSFTPHLIIQQIHGDISLCYALGMLEIHNLTKESQIGLIVDNFSMIAMPGEIICMQCPASPGQVNSAKQFCELLVGLRRQSAGSISIETYDMIFEPEMAKRLIGYMPKDGPQPASLSGREFLYLESFLYNGFVINDKDLNEAWLDGYIKDYSNEQKLTLGLLAALSHKPKLLLLDRPFDGVGQEASHLLVNTLRNFSQKQGIVIFTTSLIENHPAGLTTRTIQLKESL